ncbi:MAG TPA: histidine kinase [Alphaproteobacteria bacterium]|nr:histidine kinase [Alphaproteobacteria bacterium]HAJ46275.1 histidine kinase [Alphaproteobacteria bacterium]
MTTAPLNTGSAQQSLGTAARRVPFWHWVMMRRRASRSFGQLRWLSFNSVLARILMINTAVLIIVATMVLVTIAVRNPLIEERMQSLLIQGRIVAEIIADRATLDSETPAIDVDKAEAAMRLAVNPTNTRARLFSNTGEPLADTRHLLARNQVSVDELPAPGRTQTWESAIRRFWNRLFETSAGRDLAMYEEGPEVAGQAFEEVSAVLNGDDPEPQLRQNATGDLIVSVAVPIRRTVSVRAVLMLSTEAGDLDAIRQEQWQTVVLVFGLGVLILVVLSYLLAWMIASPIRSLAVAADRVRRGEADVTEIPQSSWTPAEINALANSFRTMTAGLTDRLDTIENFAADVAHEIKNPLTSLRSAIETLGRADDENKRQKLMGLIQNDVRRIDRLISDISEASRLDAELSRERASPFDLSHLLQTVMSLYQDQDPPLPVSFQFDMSQWVGPATVLGREGALAQVFRNVLDNAISFSPKGGRIAVTMGRRQAPSGRTEVVVSIEDEGPGIPPESVERIFERFYTHRPAAHGFGKNSGLGLSISKQIVEQHGGTIAAANREGQSGAVFTITLPVS